MNKRKVLKWLLSNSDSFLLTNKGFELKITATTHDQELIKYLKKELTK